MKTTTYRGWDIEFNGSHSYLLTSPNGKQQLVADSLKDAKKQIDFVEKKA